MLRLALGAVMAAGILATPTPTATAAKTDAAIGYAAHAVWAFNLPDGRVRIFDVEAITYQHARRTMTYAGAFVSLCPVQAGACPVVRGSPLLARVPNSAFTVDPVLRQARLQVRLRSSGLVTGMWAALSAGAEPGCTDPACAVLSVPNHVAAGRYLCPPGLLVAAYVERPASSRVRMFGQTFVTRGGRYAAQEIAVLAALPVVVANGSYDESRGYCTP